MVLSQTVVGGGGLNEIICSRFSRIRLVQTKTLCFQALLQEAHDVEVQKQKQEDKLQRQLAFRKEDRATEVQTIISAVAACLCAR